MLVVYLKCGLDPGVVACCCQVLQEKYIDNSITWRGKQMPFENKIDQTQDRGRGKCHNSKELSQCHGRGFGSVHCTGMWHLPRFFTYWKSTAGPPRNGAGLLVGLATSHASRSLSCSWPRGSVWIPRRCTTSLYSAGSTWLLSELPWSSCTAFGPGCHATPSRQRKKTESVAGWLSRVVGDFVITDGSSASPAGLATCLVNETKTKSTDPTYRQ